MAYSILVGCNIKINIRSKQLGITALLGFLVLFLGAGTINPSLKEYHEQEENRVLKSQETKIMYTAYIQNQKRNEAIREAEELKSVILIGAANASKNTTPFTNSKSRNASNRYAEWTSSNRDIKENSSRHYALLQFEKYDWAVETEWGCLDRLWWHESNWKPKAGDASGARAFGIPQAAPGNKMATAGKDWKTNPHTQIDWGLDYISERYEKPCKAFSFWKNQAENGDLGYGWY